MAGDLTAVLDRAAFDDFADLFDGDELHEMIEQWHADTTASLAAMAAALARGDRARLGDLAHHAAGGALALGAIALARACEGLRAAAENDGGAVASADVDRVRGALAATHAAMVEASAGGDS